jgi:hypothetical protein
MMYRQTFAALLAVFLFVSVAAAQKAEVTVSLNEAFFDALLDSVYQNFDPPQFQISNSEGSATCSESVKILREMNGVRTSVRFRDGKIYVPLAFSGNYNPPLIGCLDFAGWAESNLELEFDKANQRLIGRVRVLNVNLNGTGGVGGTVIARLIQSSIDKKLNPIEILAIDKMSIGVPIQKSGNLNMKAVAVTPEIGNGVVNIRIGYEFRKN